jgi:hypothetical protein
MKIYLELLEVLPEGSAEEPDFIRIDVTEWSQSDIDTAIQLMREHAQTYEHYVIQIHYCLHDTGAPCTTNLIESR